MENDESNRLLSVNFHLYKPCNERCRYCFATFPDVLGQLTGDEAERLVLEFQRSGTKKLTFVGGEPTLHSDLPRLLRVAHGSGVTTAIVSNGAKLRAVIEAAPGAVDWVGLSLDSADETVQKELGRGHGSYVRDTVALFDFVRERGIRTKLNTVVTSLNWQEDLSALVRRVRPERWKVFQVLAIAGQNNGKVEPLLIAADQFQAFVARHAGLAAEGLAPVAEDNEAMTGSDLMVSARALFRQHRRPPTLQPADPRGRRRGGARRHPVQPGPLAAAGRCLLMVAAILAVEGLDGSGKSTTVKLLAARLGAVVIRNPPDSLAAERVAADHFEPEARRRWYMNANRVAMEQARVLAAQGTPAVLDRSIASTLSFGAAERGLVARREDIPIDFPIPDLIVMLALPESVRRHRHRNRGDKATSEEERLVTDDAFRERVLAGYRNICSVEVDATVPPESVVSSIAALLVWVGGTQSVGIAYRADGLT